MSEHRCAHQHGAMIKALGLWVCGKCFSKLSDRPVRYGMVRFGLGDVRGVRQDIVWQSEVRVSADQTTLADFLLAMVRRLRHRNHDMATDEAYEMALDIMRTQPGKPEFGDSNHDWSRASAIGIVDEEMSYWETGCAGGNA